MRKRAKKGFQAPRKVIKSEPKPPEEYLCYNVEYTKGKKKKPICQGVLTRIGNTFILYDSGGAQKNTFRDAGIATLGYGSEFFLSSFSIMVTEQTSYEAFSSGQVFCPVHIQKSLEKMQQSPPQSVLFKEGQTETDITKCLRPHQRVGVEFLYQCVQGKRSAQFHGAILADAMGLGKTLQSLALASVLMNRQNPFYRVLVTCPVTLVRNWMQEITKWLPDCKKYQILSGTPFEPVFKEFLACEGLCFMIVGYETLRSHSSKISKPFDLLIADEGHRLKNAEGNQTIKSLNMIKCTKRIILTGTPIQNNLDELYSLCNFVNPGFFGDVETFRNVFSRPIGKSRDRKSSIEDKKLGDTRAQYLSRVVSLFTLRRTAELLKTFLPPKHEYILFCRLSSQKIQEYKTLLATKEFKGVSNTAGALQCIRHLRDLCIPSVDNIDCGKLNLLQTLLQDCKQYSTKIVLVSNFRKTLDVLQQLCDQVGLPFCRLDGQTDPSTRQELVNAFNSPGGKLVFLLSAKAGGVGLNLVGAQRLVLLEPEWNPSIDQQAIARIWRDGQSEECFVYRLVSTASIEEKIIQRQFSKDEVKTLVADKEQSDRQFDKKELSDLFRYDDRIQTCETHQILCNRRDDFSWEFHDSLENIKCKTLSTSQKSLSAAVSFIFESTQ